MVPKKQPEGIVVLLDVGCNMTELTNSGETFLNASIDCISQIILRKLFSESTDQFAIILFGTEKTQNNLAEGNEYCNIAVLTEHFSQCSWELLRLIKELKVNTDCIADWLDAIVVAVQFIKDETNTKMFSQNKIVLLSNFRNPVCEDKIDVIVQTLKDMDIDLTVIGPDIPTNAATGVLSTGKYQGEILISSMVDELQGTVCSFDDAFAELMNLQRKSVKPTPWNSMFLISSKIKIPIRVFKKIAEVKPYKWKTSILDDENASVMKEKGYTIYDDRNEVEKNINIEDVINAYRFGTTIVPFSDIDKQTMSYQSGPKGLYLIGCTSRESVPQYIMMSESYIVIAKQEDKVGNLMLEAFIQAMYDDNNVGIVRRVYLDNSAPNIGVLIPEVKEESRYLVYVQIPFAEDEHIYRFPSLNHIQLTSEQTKYIDLFIDSMDLDETETKPEMYDPARTYDPYEQYLLSCLSHKGLYPNEPIPDEINQKFSKSLQPVPELMEASATPLKHIKEIFPLEKVVHKTKKNLLNSHAVDKQHTEDEATPSILFRKPEEKAFSAELIMDLISKDVESFPKIFREVQISVENYIESDDVNIAKLLTVIKYIRKHCCTKDVYLYNNWITKLKLLAIKKNLLLFWNDIASEKLGLITRLENPESNVNPDETAEFLKLQENEDDSLYGSMNTNSIDDEWLDDL